MPGFLPAALRPRSVRLYFTAVLLSQLGSSAMLLATGVWLKQLTGSSSVAALVQLCIWIPNLAAPVLGAAVDRWPRRRLIVAVNAAMGVCLLPLLLVRGGELAWLVFAVMAVYGVSYVLLGAAEPALVADLVPREDLPALNGLRMSLTEGCKLVAPALGAGLLTWCGAGWVVALDSASFVAAALLVVRMGVIESRRYDSGEGRDTASCFPQRPGERRESGAPEGARPAGRSAVRDAAEGLRVLAADRPVRRLVPLIGLAVFCFNLRQTFVFAVLDGLGRPAAFAGVLAPVQGAGSVAAGLAAGKLVARLGEARTAALGMAVAALAAAVTLLPSAAAVLAGSALWGLGMPWLLIAGTTLLQTRIAPEFHGRALATGATVMWGPIAPSIPVGAALIPTVGWRLPLAATAVAGPALAAAAARGGRRADEGQESGVSQSR